MVCVGIHLILQVLIKSARVTANACAGAIEIWKLCKLIQKYVKVCTHKNCKNIKKYAKNKHLLKKYQKYPIQEILILSACANSKPMQRQLI